VSFVPAHSFVGEPDAPKLAFVLHGALGSGNNLRSLASKVSTLRPEYRFCLIDLRHHGASLGAPPPNTLDSCARDLSVLAAHLRREPDVIIGHSFGGKTALMFASLYPGRARQVWLLDSNPGRQEATADHEVLRVLALVKRTTTPAAERKDVVEQLAAQGISSGTANWLATNLDRREEGFVWRFNLDAIYELMLDYFAEDLWPVLKHRASEADFRVVVAERSDRWAPANRKELEELARSSPVKLHLVPNAGHWVHVDNPAFLIELVSSNLY